MHSGPSTPGCRYICTMFDGRTASKHYNYVRGVRSLNERLCTGIEGSTGVTRRVGGGDVSRRGMGPLKKGANSGEGEWGRKGREDRLTLIQQGMVVSECASSLSVSPGSSGPVEVVSVSKFEGCECAVEALAYPLLAGLRF